MDTNTPLDIELLGRIAVRVGDTELTLRGELPRALLARLALAAGEPVAGELLVRELWADPPETAAVAVRGNISKLRAAGLDPYLHGGRGGYRLDVDSEHVDLLRLRTAVRELRAAVAEGADGAASGDRLADLDGVAALLWSGEAVPELESQPFAARLRAELAEERRFAGQELVAALIARGDHQRALAGAGMLRAAHPLAEEPARLEALALAGTGRTSEALATIDAFAERLADELGLELPAGLAELRLQVLRADPEVAPAADARRVERHGIPLPLTHFVGRQAELAALAEARGRARLVTLVGPGGVGKSRLAVESARRTGAEVDDEQWMVDLAALPEGGDVLRAVAEAVGAVDSTAEAVIRRLAGRRALLLLDNAEHVLEPARLAVRRLLEGCEGLCVLITSREALRIPGERMIAVAPFVGDAAAEAVALFAARAADARSGFVVDEANRAEVRELCAALDGMPLALELAAARLDVMELADLADSMLGAAAVDQPGEGGDDTGEAAVDRRAASRHSSLVDAIGWSVALLEPDELALLAQLARFAGTFDFADIAAVCTVGRGGGPVGDAVSTAVRLAQQSLIAVIDREGRSRRYRVLESVKAFMRARHPLAEADAAAWAARHAAWYAELADRLDPELRGAGKHRARDLLDQASPDLRLAFEHALAAGDRRAALRIVAGQAEHWMRKGTLADGRAAIVVALGMAGRADAAVEARAYVGAALLSYQGGAYEEALGYMHEGFVAATAAGDVGRQALLLAYSAYGRSLFGDAEAAEEQVAQATALMEQVEPWVRCSVLLCVGQTLRALGRPAQALEALQRSKTIAVRTGYAWIATSATYVTGKVLVDVRRGQDAIDVLLPGVAFAIADEDPTSALALLHLIGGASAFVERQAVGATIFAAVDRLGARYDYNPVLAEGDDARVHRERVAMALSKEEQARAAARGTGLELDELFALASSLGRKRKAAESAAA
ncbi:ATP-binding protein [Agromyces soli]